MAAFSNLLVAISKKHFGWGSLDFTHGVDSDATASLTLATIFQNITQQSRHCRPLWESGGQFGRRFVIPV